MALCECHHAGLTFVTVGVKSKLVLQVSIYAAVHHSQASVLSTVGSTLESRDISPPCDITVLLAHSFGGRFIFFPASIVYILAFASYGYRSRLFELKFAETSWPLLYVFQGNHI